VSPSPLTGEGVSLQGKLACVQHDSGFSILPPAGAVPIGLYAGVLGEAAIVTEVNDTVNAAVKGFPALLVDTCVLAVRGNIGDDKDLGVTGLPVEVAAREKKRIAVQIIEHITVFQAATEFLEDDNILSIVGVEGVPVISDTVTVGVAVLVHDGPGLPRAGFTKEVCNRQVPPGGSKLNVTEK